MALYPRRENFSKRKIISAAACYMLRPFHPLPYTWHLYSSPNDRVKTDEISQACSTKGKEVHARFWWEKLKEIAY
jgi:hypothetical protein